MIFICCMLSNYQIIGAIFYWMEEQFFWKMWFLGGTVINWLETMMCEASMYSNTSGPLWWWWRGGWWITIQPRFFRIFSCDQQLYNCLSVCNVSWGICNRQNLTCNIWTSSAIFQHYNEEKPKLYWKGIPWPNFPGKLQNSENPRKGPKSKSPFKV